MFTINTLTTYPEGNVSIIVILAVAHKEFTKNDLQKHPEQGCIIYDAKEILSNKIYNERL